MIGLYLNRRIDALEERQRRVAREVDRRCRLGDDKARLGHIDVKADAARLAHPIDARFDGRLLVGRIEAEQLLLPRFGARPVGKADQPGAGIDQFILAMVAERDRLRLELSDSKRGRRGDLLDGEALRLRRRCQANRCAQNQRNVAC